MLRILRSAHLKPWRVHSWLSSKVPRDDAFAAGVRTISDLFTRALGNHEVVLCVDEKTSIQPRRRKSPTRPARARKPVGVEHEYVRGGALQLYAAFNTRTGEVIGWDSPQKRADEFVGFLDLLDASFPATVTAVHIVLDNLIVHKCKRVRAWLKEHQRFQFHFPAVHSSWMNQVEQWFSILARKALRVLDFENTLELDRHIQSFIQHWNARCGPFNWNTKSVAKVLAKCSAAEAIPECT